jgi:hypothetical protein
MGFAENLGLLLQWDATRGKWGKNGWSDRCSCFFKGEKGLKKKKKKKKAERLVWCRLCKREEMGGEDKISGQNIKKNF